MARATAGDAIFFAVMGLAIGAGGVLLVLDAWWHDRARLVDAAGVVKVGAALLGMVVAWAQVRKMGGPRPSEDDEEEL